MHLVRRARSRFSTAHIDNRVAHVAGSGSVGADPAPSSSGWQLVAVAGTALGAYHGYRRNESVGWAVGWALLGGMFPFVALPIAYAQGFGDRA